MQSKIENFLKKIDDRVQVIGPMSIDKSQIDNQLPSLIVDGGLNHQLALHSMLSIGDGDSIDEPLKNKVDLILERDKSQSDLSHALAILENCEAKSIELHGFLAGRKDHEFINYLECLKFLKDREDCTLNLNPDIKCLSKGRFTLKHQGIFSVVILENNLIDISGDVKFPFRGELTPLSSHGLSNDASGTIVIEVTHPTIMFF